MSSIFTTLKKDYKSLAVGCFDGLHRGHFELFKKLKQDESAILIISKPIKQALTPLFLMRELAPFELISTDFERLKELSGKDFLELLANEFKHLRKIVVGYDFAFGKNRACKALDIERLSAFESVIVPEFKLRGISVHASAIKELLNSAKIGLANELLGRAYELRGALIKGQGLGSKELLATLNLECKGFFIPAPGVYASFTSLLEPKTLPQTLINRRFKSVTFIGQRLSTDGKFSIETHILEPNFKDFEIPPNTQIRIEFIDFLRHNQKFENLNLLKAQIQNDCHTALQILKD